LENDYLLIHKSSYLNEEVNRTELSPSVSLPRVNLRLKLLEGVNPAAPAAAAAARITHKNAASKMSSIKILETKAREH
jgi:hypothetical protein